jgi:hypothetical protein
MRPLLAAAPLLTLLVGSAYPQQPAVLPPCAVRSAEEMQRLEDLARQYHPEALAPGARPSFQLVGLVLDSTCQVVRHAAGVYGSGRAGTVDAELRVLFPDLRRSDFRSAGALSRQSLQPGGVKIVWAVLGRH